MDICFLERFPFNLKNTRIFIPHASKTAWNSHKRGSSMFLFPPNVANASDMIGFLDRVEYFLADYDRFRAIEHLKIGGGKEC